VVDVEVAVPGRAYPVVVGAGALERLPEVCRRYTAALVVSDTRVASVTGEVRAKLDTAGVAHSEIELEGGEGAKTLPVLTKVLQALEARSIDRGGCIVAVGGGSIGDLAGFAAAIWLRGIAHVQVPTTLLAMVDSSIGGKTGINSLQAKNAIGAFWQPGAVLADTSTLASLGDDEYRDAFAEIVKYAVAMDSDLFRLLSGEPVQRCLRERDAVQLETVIGRCVQLKAQVVAADERDQGRRAILNYGHTVGHALESVSAYSISHGQAVALGMRAAAWIATETGRSGPDVAAGQQQLLSAFGLPGPAPQVSTGDVLDSLARDKKARSGDVDWVLLREVGRAETGQRVPEEAVRRAVEQVLQTK
jgi:3-dehydroquinate synthase